MQHSVTEVMGDILRLRVRLENLHTDFLTMHERAVAVEETYRRSWDEIAGIQYELKKQIVHLEKVLSAFKSEVEKCLTNELSTTSSLKPTEEEGKEGPLPSSNTVIERMDTPTKQSAPGVETP